MVRIRDAWLMIGSIATMLLVTLPTPQISKLFSAWSLGEPNLRQVAKVGRIIIYDKKDPLERVGLFSGRDDRKHRNFVARNTSQPLMCKHLSALLARRT